MSWILIAILSYFLFSIVSVGDKYILKGPVNSVTYTFYIGILGILSLFLIPFTGFFVPGFEQLLMCLLAGIVYIFANFFFLKGLERFEASRIVPSIGGLLPLFIFILVYFFSAGQEVLNPLEILSFVLLISGSIAISIEPGKKISLKSFEIASVAALFYAFSFIFNKYVYLEQSFWNGFLWIRIAVFFTALSFLLVKSVRRELFFKRTKFNKKTGLIFIAIQIVGAGGFILQNIAVNMAGFSHLSLINALQGVQYFFLFIFATFISLKFPQVFKEKISWPIIIQKVFSILVISAGLIILVSK